MQKNDNIRPNVFDFLITHQIKKMDILILEDQTKNWLGK